MKEKVFVIGKGRTCDIILADETVSSIHAEIFYTKNNEINLRDRNSTNGTFLLKNKKFQKVEQTYLSPTDVVKFGLCEIGVKDLLEYLHLKMPPAYQDNHNNNKKNHKVEGDKLLRCIYCGAAKKEGQSCKTCGNETRSIYAKNISR
ncbi:Forkhead-associated domain protein [Candidatus Magnetomorum sp. HK-1]|nr:Forkhead-associated domain protein [Candidatus Magnetomorum sp. HK-1]